MEPGWGRTVAHQVLLGSPSVHYLPVYSARALLNHMRGPWGIPDPRARLLVDPARTPNRALVVSRRRAEIPDGDWDTQVRDLLWHLPPGRSILPMPDDWRLQDMTPLEQLAGQVPGPKPGR